MTRATTGGLGRPLDLTIPPHRPADRSPRGTAADRLAEAAAGLSVDRQLVLARHRRRQRAAALRAGQLLDRFGSGH